MALAHCLRSCRLPTSAFEGGYVGSSACQPSTLRVFGFQHRGCKFPSPRIQPADVRLPSIT
ncbi:hypothetical protein WH47_01102 [Habropoda laboriosa]|uniref:Uncharacterized protein n=1 Tax=Habropoda laboriosa TaxID=597456 RepID=A0A0L7R0Z1_9HYME|nr:hypothetical protein WH47_01102 [Habropoda laboriosa]